MSIKSHEHDELLVEKITLNSGIEIEKSEGIFEIRFSDQVKTFARKMEIDESYMNMGHKSKWVEMAIILSDMKKRNYLIFNRFSGLKEVQLFMNFVGDQ